MNADPFDTLGVPPSFSLPKSTLERQHRELSRTLHPDRYAGAPAGERRQALTRAIDVNEAFRKLRDPVTRGDALLARLGVNVGGAEAPAAPTFLMTVMELREGLSQAGRAKDLDKIEQLRAAVEKSEREVREKLAAAFDKLVQDTGDTEAALIAKQQLGELRYYRRFLEEAGNLLDEID